MKYRHSLSFILAFLIAAVAVVSAEAQTITGSLCETSAAPGATVRGSIVLDIPAGLHVNSNRPYSEYAIPTTVELSGNGVTPGAITYPEGTNRKFQFSESELNVYEGKVVIPFTLTVSKDFRGGRLSVKALVRYQACTEEVCYQPKNKEIVMTAVVKK
ncbi:MAG: protein-disulfide reductase DsbD domain-containing protein [Pyrinomonadaceae bacterium]